MLDLHTILTEPESPPEWLIEDLFYKGQMVCCAGEAGVGKSFLWYHIAICIAAGLPFLGHQVSKGKVLYFDEENGPSDLSRYLRWAWGGLGKPDISTLVENLHIVHFELARRGRFEYMLEQACKVGPSLIVVDTATTVCGIQDENDNAEASRVIAKLRFIGRSAGPRTTIVILKHTKFTHDLTERRTIRGAKTWLNEVDATMFHVAVPGRPRKDGLRPTVLEPDKVRAWGLRDSLKIFPAWIERNISLSLNITST